MRFNFVLIFNFLFASAVLADRTLEQRSKLLDDVERAAASNPPNISNVLYQAGSMVALNKGTIQNASALFVVPHMANLLDAGVLISVNIDGEGPLCKSFLSAGIAIHVSEDGPTYKAYSVLPGHTKRHFFNISLFSGDLVKVALSVPNATFCLVTITTVSESTLYTEPGKNMLYAESSKNMLHTESAAIDVSLCRQSAKWVTTINPGWTPPSTYGNVTFSMPVVYDIYGNDYGPRSAAMILHMLDDYDHVLANVTYNDVSILISPLPVG